VLKTLGFYIFLGLELALGLGTLLAFLLLVVFLERFDESFESARWLRLS
jgi:hypothetical protein